MVAIPQPHWVTRATTFFCCVSLVVDVVRCRSEHAPPPPAAAGIRFFDGFSDYAVLQRAPAQAALYGYLGTGGTGATVRLSTTTSGAGTSDDGVEVVVAATVSDGGQWKVLLPPHPAGGDFTVTATCTGCKSGPHSAKLLNVTFGDVVYCSGQSNMWLPLLHTLTRNQTLASLANGKYANIRLMAGNSQDSNTFPWKTAAAAATDGSCSYITHGGNVAGCSLFDFSAVCYYYAEALTDKFEAAGQRAPPLGLISTAIGGSMIEEWLPNSTIADCVGASVAPHNQKLWNQNIVPFLDMTVWGWLWCKCSARDCMCHTCVLSHTVMASLFARVCLKIKGRIICIV
eukprot:COSAG02_NODE_2976_length_7633_cov_2.195248_1_plen_343_part_00